MASEVDVKAGSGAISTSIRILRQHIGNTAIDLWLDSDHNGRPDRWVKRFKGPNEREGELIELGSGLLLQDKVIQWIWQPSQPSELAEGWKVSIDLKQGGKSLPGFPRELTGQYPPDKWGIFQTWVKLV